MWRRQFLCWGMVIYNRERGVATTLLLFLPSTFVFCRHVFHYLFVSNEYEVNDACNALLMRIVLEAWGRKAKRIEEERRRASTEGTEGWEITLACSDSS